jgi:hypothetical protein
VTSGAIDSERGKVAGCRKWFGRADNREETLRLSRPSQTHKTPLGSRLRLLSFSHLGVFLEQKGKGGDTRKYSNVCA